MNDRKGYLFPEPYDPGETVCIRVLVPKHAIYIAEFWHAYEHFTKWSSWARDDAHTAKEVAALWLSCFNVARTYYESGQECEAPMSFDMRTKPGAAWITQVSVDGGVTWHDAIIQPNWAAQTVISPPVTSADAANDLSTAMLRSFWQWIVDQIIAGLDGSVSQTVTINNILGQLAPYGNSPALADALNGAYDTIEAMDAPTRAEWQTDCQYTDMNDAQREFINDNPYDWLNKLSDWLTSTLDSWSGTLMEWLNKAAAALGGQSVWNFSANTGGGGGGAGFGGDCESVIEFDFTGSNANGWVGATSVSCGSLVPTVGVNGWGWIECSGIRGKIGYLAGFDNISAIEIDIQVGAAGSVAVGVFTSEGSEAAFWNGAGNDAGAGIGVITRHFDIDPADDIASMYIGYRNTGGEIYIRKVRIYRPYA